MPRFVILEHDWPERHWDLLLEAGEVLRAWRLLAEPGPGRTVPAEPNFDHRLIYLDYEGPLTGDRGRVTRWDAGEFEWVEADPRRLIADMRGHRICGRAVVEDCSACFVGRVEVLRAPPGDS
jgi:hypothetical protein